MEEHAKAAEEGPGRPRRVPVPVVVFSIAVAVATGIAAFQIVAGMDAVAPEDGGEPQRVPPSPGQVVVALSFIVWPALALRSVPRAKTGLVWVATVLYLLQSVLFGLSYGGHHFVIGGPLMLLGALWQTFGRTVTA